MSNVKIAIEAPLNKLSFGNVSIAILRELYKRNVDVSLFLIGQSADLSAQLDDPDFNSWLNSAANKAFISHSKDIPVLKLWHINGSNNSVLSNKNYLFTFHELDQLTPIEVNNLKLQDKVFVTSKFTQSVFKENGVNSVYLPLGFDSHNFFKLPRRPKINGKISFFIGGKWEPSRKRHAKTLSLWAKKYGNNPDYILNLSISNPFLKEEDLKQSIIQALNGRQYSNINFLPWTQTNLEYNATLQSSDIVLSLSGGEGFDLVAYHATAMGAWPVALNAHVYKDYLNSNNAILVPPTSQFPCYDGIFFHQGAPFNQGNFFDYSEENFYLGCEEAINKVKTIGINQAGLELQKNTYAKTVDILLENI